MECKNCHTELIASSEFCHSCGGKIIRKRLTFKNLFEHLSETFFNYDNKLLRTLVDLFKKPEMVIGGYIDGVRKKYVNPISFFGLALTLSGLLLFLIKKFYKDAIFPKDILSEAKNDVALQKMTSTISDFTLEYSSLLFSVLIPLAAVIGIIVFFNKKYNFTEHIVIYLYSLSLYSLLGSFLGLFVLLISPDQYVNLAFFLYAFVIIYNMYALKRIFKLSAKQLVIKTLFFFVIAFIMYVGISIIAAIVFFTTGIMDIQDFAPK